MDPISSGGPSAAARAARDMHAALRTDRPGAMGESGEALGFGDTLRRVIGEVVELQDESQDAITAFLRGEPVEIHQVMAAVEEAGIALELLIELRNRLTEAYRTVIQMQT